MNRLLKRKVSRLKEIRRQSGKSYIRIIREMRMFRKKYDVSFNEYYLYNFDSRDEKFAENFLPSFYKYSYLRLLNPAKYYILARNKYLAHLWFREAGIPCAQLILYYDPISGLNDSDRACDSDGIIRILKEKQPEEYIVKHTESFHGDSVFLFRKTIFTDKGCVLEKHDGQRVMLTELLNEGGGSPLLFEKKIIQTEQMSSLNASSVNTIRFMTALYPDGHVDIIATFIKIGRNGACVDNAGSGGNLDAALDPKTGRVVKVTRFDGFRHTAEVTSHPDSGMPLIGLALDNWPDIVEKVKDFQRKTHWLKAIGWDIALTDEGPVVVEMNDCWDETGQLFLHAGWRSEITACYQAWKNHDLR